MNKLMLLLDGASEFDRRLLRGLVRYTRENGDWLFFRVPLALQHDGDCRNGPELGRQCHRRPLAV